MPLATTAAAVVVSLLLSLLPATAVPRAGRPAAQPVTVIALTDRVGRPTPLAAPGLGPATTNGGATPSPGSVDRWRPSAIALRTEPMATPEFFVAGLTWSGGTDFADTARIHIRVLEASGWTEWFEVEDETSQEGPDHAVTAGTEPVITGGARALQVQVTEDTGELPPDLHVALVPARPAEHRDVVSQPLPRPDVMPTVAGGIDHVIDEAASGTFLSEAAQSEGRAQFASWSGQRPRVTSDAPALIGIAPATATVPVPRVLTRSEWGADESLPIDAGIATWTVRHSALDAAVLHHTAGTNTYSWDDAAAVVRGIYYFHTVTRGWGDIGYNFLIDRWGRVYEGRKGTLASDPGTMVVAGHARGYNDGSVGISVMGDFADVQAPEASLDAVAHILAWQFARSGVDLSSPSSMVSPGSPTLPAGTTLPRVFGHKDVASTACPGTISGAIPDLVLAARRQMPQLFLLNNAFTTRADISFYFGEQGEDAYTGDWNGDGADTIAVRTGATYSIRATNSYGAPDQVITYGRSDDEVLVGDWDGDGTDTLAVRRGATYYIRNTLTSGVADVVLNYGRVDDEVLVGDWDGDGTDTLAVRRGATYYIRNSLTSGVAESTVRYGLADDQVFPGDWDGDGTDTLAVRRGATYYIRNSLTSGVADVVLTYGRVTDTVLAGDWDGDGADTLGVRRTP